nr:MAG TPA: zinc finger domain protein [Caudoviricetes sp.]
MCSFCEKNFFDTLAEILSNALFDLVAGNAFAALIHKKRRSADSKRISNGFCVHFAAQCAQLVADGLTVHLIGSPPFRAPIVLKTRK